ASDQRPGTSAERARAHDLHTQPQPPDRAGWAARDAGVDLLLFWCPHRSVHRPQGVSSRYRLRGPRRRAGCRSRRRCRHLHAGTFRLWQDRGNQPRQWLRDALRSQRPCARQCRRYGEEGTAHRAYWLYRPVDRTPPTLRGPQAGSSSRSDDLHQALGWAFRSPHPASSLPDVALVIRAAAQNLPGSAGSDLPPRVYNTWLFLSPPGARAWRIGLHSCSAAVTSGSSTAIRRSLPASTHLKTPSRL